MARNQVDGGASLDTGRSLMSGSSGKWAGEQWLKAIKNGQAITPEALRTLDTLRKDEWIAFDNALIEGGLIRLRGIADLIAAGLVTNITNGLGKTVFQYELVSDLEDAIVSMDGVVRSENDRLDFSLAGLPLPITHKDWNLNLRTLAASRDKGEPLDVTNARIAGRKVAEKTEEMLFIGSKTFGGLPIYGYTTHPSRNTTSFGTGGAWTGTKTGQQVVDDVLAMVAIAEADLFFGPFILYVGSGANLFVDNDFKANGDQTIRERVLKLDSISDIRSSDKMPSGSVILVQMTSDVVTLINGEPLQTVQWDVNGGFELAFKAFQILVPLIRADSEGRSGIVHMS